MLRAQVAQENLVLAPVRIVAVQRLAADGPVRALDVLCRPRLEPAPRLEPRIHLQELLARDTTPLLERRPLGRRLAAVAPRVPTLDLRRVLEGHDRQHSTCKHDDIHGAYDTTFTSLG